jgi:autotransporter translocation and assembly factor TamB
VPPAPAPTSLDTTAPEPGPLARAADVTPPDDSPARTVDTGQDAEANDLTPSLLEQATIDVTLRVPNNLVLRADDLRVDPEGPGLGAMNVTLGADLRAQQRAGEALIVTGAVTFVRGQYDFQGRRFLVARDSAIRFQGPDVTNPTLDLTAVRMISGVEARMHVEGTAQDPRLRLSSDPSLDEGDILALIVFDRPLDELGQGEQVSVARRAGELLGGRITGTLATSLRDVLDVDLLEIDAFGEGGPAVTVGNQLGERLFVRFRQQVGASDTTQILLEYALLGNLRLQTSVTQGAQTDRSPGQRVERSGIDLLYFFLY